jgi:hypothetical protein
MLISKFHTTFTNPVEYTANWEKDSILFNELIGKEISIEFTGLMFCKVCNKSTKKFFGEGFCFQCFNNSPENSPCILKPELCEAHLGKGRDTAWEEKHHNQPHVVYLAATDVVKVGVTRSSQIPTRWIDQGASSVIIFAETPNRYEAGKLEVELKAFYSDKTNYRKMLQNEIDENIDLIEEKWQTVEQLPSDLQTFISENDVITELTYPVITFPKSVQVLNLDKTPLIKGRLNGIKGQYLLFENDLAINIRRHTGYDIQLIY